ncbi:MAG: hypothetical protein DMG42_03420 [Acidobacteria bacterium]|nr:MAG: hypothetical protein DMG42_03420 [Acidobacteriota bacterium]
MSDTKTSSVAGSPLAIPVGQGVTRRDFLNEITMGALGIAGLGSVAVTYQYFSPNVLFEPSTTFRAGNPDLYPVHSVTFLQDQQVYIVRMPEKIEGPAPRPLPHFAISLTADGELVVDKLQIIKASQVLKV